MTDHVLSLYADAAVLAARRVASSPSRHSVSFHIAQQRTACVRAMNESSLMHCVAARDD
jgi:hypothetical protein